MLRKFFYLGILLASTPISTWAFNGVHLTGNGQASAGSGGVSLAGGLDRTSIFDNPANLSWQKDGADIQMSWLNIRSKGTFIGQPDGFSSSQNVPLPGLAITQHYDDKLSYGLSIVGSGATVNYHESAIRGYPAPDAKDFFAVATISPSVAYQVLPKLSLGAALNLGIQNFRATGVLAGVDGSGAPIFAPSHGNEWSTGMGFTLGGTWEVLPDWTVGASYTSETKFSGLSGYKDDLLANSRGKINLPERYGAGIQYRVNPKLLLAADILRINWNDADGLGKKGVFNWQDQTVYRVGAEYRLNDISTLRVGYNHADDLILPQDTLVNFYANDVAKEAWTIGYGHKFDFATVNLAYEYAVNNKVNGSGSSTGTNLSNQNHVFTIGLSKDF